MKRLLVTVLLALLQITGSWASAGNRKPQHKEEEIDHIALAGLMIKDGYIDRAMLELAAVDTTAVGIDLARYYLLLGLVGLKQGDYESAAKSLSASMEAGQPDPIAPVFLSQARFQLGDCEGAVAALDLAGETALAMAGTYSIRAQCHQKGGRHEAVYEVLSAGLKRHPGDPELVMQRILVLVEMGLFVQATEEGQQYLERSDASASEYATVAEAFIRSGESSRATIILEEARLRFSDDRNIVVQLARAYLGAERPLIAARIFRDLARKEPPLILDAAELYKRGGRPAQALYLNASVEDQESKIRQRLGLLIEMERFEEAASLEPRLVRLGLLNEDLVTYALAYALFQIGKSSQCEKYLSRIRDTDLFGKAMELRRAIERCDASGWECEIGGAR